MPAPRCVLLALCLLLAPEAAAQGSALRTLVLHGDPAPGTGSTLSNFQRPISLSATGFAFVGDVAGVSGSDDGVFAERGSGLEAIALVGQTAPGTGGRPFVTFQGARMDGAGRVVFAGTAWSQALGGVSGLFRDDGSGLAALLVGGDPLPGGGTFREAFAPSVAEAGEIAFRADYEIEPGSGYEGLFLLAPGGTSALVLEHDPAPGTGGGTFTGFGAPALNADGSVAFTANVASPAVDHGLFLVGPGGVEALVLEGDVLPGTGGGTADELDFTRPGIDPSGRVAFHARVIGGSTEYGIFTVADGVVTPVALRGDTVPGTGGAWLDVLDRTVAMDPAGQPVFWALLAGGDASYGILRGSEPAVLIGDPLPGTGGGSVGVPNDAVTVASNGDIGFVSGVFQGSAIRGVFRAIPLSPTAVPALPAPGLALLALALAGAGARRLAARQPER